MNFHKRNFHNLKENCQRQAQQYKLFFKFNFCPIILKGKRIIQYFTQFGHMAKLGESTF
jgi:hypothetical protein